MGPYQAIKVIVPGRPLKSMHIHDRDLSENDVAVLNSASTNSPTWLTTIHFPSALSRGSKQPCCGCPGHRLFWSTCAGPPTHLHQPSSSANSRRSRFHLTTAAPRGRLRGRCYARPGYGRRGRHLTWRLGARERRSLCRRELEEESIAISPLEEQRLRERGRRLTEPNLKLWITLVCVLLS
jgi:hypothetical protein